MQQMRMTLIIWTMVLAGLASCTQDNTTYVSIDDMGTEQDFRFEQPDSTIKATLTITGESSGPFKLFVSDGLFTSTFAYPAGPVDDEKSFDWYDSALLINYVPDPEGASSGMLKVGCTFHTAR